VVVWAIENGCMAPVSCSLAFLRAGGIVLRT